MTRQRNLYDIIANDNQKEYDTPETQANSDEVLQLVNIIADRTSNRYVLLYKVLVHHLFHIAF